MFRMLKKYFKILLILQNHKYCVCYSTLSSFVTLKKLVQTTKLDTVYHYRLTIEMK